MFSSFHLLRTTTSVPPKRWGTGWCKSIPVKRDGRGATRQNAWQGRPDGHAKRCKDGKAHYYWNLMGSVRIGQHVFQPQALCLVGLNDAHRSEWQYANDAFDENGHALKRIFSRGELISRLAVAKSKSDRACGVCPLPGIARRRGLWHREGMEKTVFIPEFSAKTPTMRRGDVAYRAHTAILRQELVPAMGCTEPIAVAYAAALARDLAGGVPERILVEASGSIIKNVKSVVVPHTGGIKGLEAAAAVGILAGDPARELDLLAGAGPDTGSLVRDYLAATPVEVSSLDTTEVFDLQVTVHRGSGTGRVRLTGGQTRVVLRERNGHPVGASVPGSPDTPVRTDRSWLTVPGIWDYIVVLDPADIRDILDRQVRCNLAIAGEGLRGDWGAGIGKVVLAAGGDGVRTRAKAWPAAGSDARMGGCGMPVIINSGSGNQGLTVSLPVIAYARGLGAPEDDLVRALALANLVAIHQKDGIGCLSAFCGATTAAAGAVAGIAYLLTHDYHTVVHAIVNTLAILPGMACDGAKASCAAKIAEAVDAALLGLDMILAGRQFHGGDGLVTKGVEATIRNIARLGHDGMRETNGEIIRIMLRNPAPQA